MYRHLAGNGILCARGLLGAAIEKNDERRWAEGKQKISLLRRYFALIRTFPEYRTVEITVPVDDNCFFKAIKNSGLEVYVPESERRLREMKESKA